LISENALEQVLTAHLPAKPAGSVRDLLSCATQQQQQPTKSGMVDFIKLMSPVRSNIRDEKLFEESNIVIKQ